MKLNTEAQKNLMAAKLGIMFNHFGKDKETHEEERKRMEKLFKENRDIYDDGNFWEIS